MVLRLRSGGGPRRARDLVFLVCASGDNPDRVIGQRPLQRLGLVPWRAHPNVALFVRLQDDWHRLHEIRPHPPYADPEKAACRILELAKAIEPVQGRIHIKKINEPFLFKDKGTPAEYGAGLALAIERGWLKMHDSGTFVS